MPGVSIVAVMKAQEYQKAAEKLRRTSLRDAWDPLSYPNSVFISYYRLNKEAFVMVLDTIQPHLQRSTIPPILQLSTTIRFLATGAFQGVIAKDVDISVGRSTVSTLMWRVIVAIETHLCAQWIKLKLSTDEKRNSKAYFYQTCQIPGIIGCIDGTHIKMQKASEDASLFLNRKGTFSVNAMIICDYEMKVRAVEAGRPGSCHDSFIWNMSSARDHFFNNYTSGDQNSRLLGGSGYGLEPFLITPYRDVAAGTREHLFNKKHASGRNIIERTIGVLKSRFWCLLGTLIYSPQKVIQITNDCCALHNICREYNIEWEEDPTWNEGEIVDNEDDINEFSQRNLYNIAKRLRDDIAAEMH